MAACGSLQHIFEKPLPENPTLLESLSVSPWNQLKNSPKTLEDQHSSSFTEIFGELHFKESDNCHHQINTYNNHHHYSSTSSHKNCTEGLGFESSDEVENVSVMNNTNSNWMRLLEDEKEMMSQNKKIMNESARRSRSTAKGGGFPPPISSLSKTGKPQLCFKSYREDGRFVLKEIRVRTEEFLHACREDGRLRLHFVQPNYEELIPEEEEGDEDDDDSFSDDGVIEKRNIINVDHE